MPEADLEQQQLLFSLTAIATGCLIGAFVYSGPLHVRKARWWRSGPFAP